MQDSRKHNYDDGYYRDKETTLHTREAQQDLRGTPTPGPVERLTPVLSLGFVVAIQLVGSVWWAATLDSRVEHVAEQVKTMVSDNYLNSQAQADKLNIQLQIDQARASDERLEKDLQELQQKLDRLYDRVYSRN